MGFKCKWSVQAYLPLGTQKLFGDFKVYKDERGM